MLGHLRKVGEPAEALAHNLLGELLRRQLDDRSSHLMREAIRRPQRSSSGHQEAIKSSTIGARTSSGQLDTLPNSSKSIRVHIMSAKIS